jgi:hypothetical protein
MVIARALIVRTVSSCAGMGPGVVRDVHCVHLQTAGHRFKTGAPVSLDAANAKRDLHRQGRETEEVLQH